VSDCLFCQIIAGEVPATIVKRSPHGIAFRDLNAQAPTHVLIVPKQHLASLNDTDDARLLGQLLLLAKEVAEIEGLSHRGYRVVVNTNREAGQSVFHLHLHVLGGRAMAWPPG
jgi:histidine triad (HIT) family protein